MDEACRMAAFMGVVANVSRLSWRPMRRLRAVATVPLQLPAVAAGNPACGTGPACTGVLCAVPSGTEALGTLCTSRVRVPDRLSAWRGPYG